MTAGIDTSPFDLAALFVAADRRDTYARLRNEHPALAIDMMGLPMFVASRYQDVSKLLRDSKARQLPDGYDVPEWFGEGPAAVMFRNQMVLYDAPDHMRLRKLINKGFTPRNVEVLRVAVEHSIADRMEELAGPGETDMMRQFADHVPAAATCAILGLPQQDWPELVALAPDFVPIFSPFPLPKADMHRLHEACRYYFEYFGRLVDERDGDGDSTVDLLIRAEQDGDRLTRDELLATLHSFLHAGYETTQAALGNGMLALLANRDQWDALVADPDRVAGAVEEILRWDAPVHFTRRVLADAFEVGGSMLAPGSVVLLALAAADRDDRRYPDADVFDIGRVDNQHLAFGGGRHFCIGAQLARLELQIAFRQLVERYPRARLVDGFVPRRVPSLVFPGLTSLPVILEP